MVETLLYRVLSLLRCIANPRDLTGADHSSVSDRELMRMHVEALFTHDAQGRMRRVNEPGGGKAPRFFFGRTAEGNVWRFRHDLGVGLIRELELACRAESVAEKELAEQVGSRPYETLLAQDAPVKSVWAGPIDRFPRLGELPDTPGTVLVTESNLVQQASPRQRPHLGAASAALFGASPVSGTRHGGKQSAPSL